MTARNLNSVFLSKLNTRLVLAESTQHSNSDINSAILARRYGRKLANLVESGDPAAAQVITLSEQARNYRNNPVVDGCVLEVLELQAYAAKHRAGLFEGVGSGLANLMLLATGSGYNSQAEFRESLNEGLMVGINCLASQILAIPPGEYAVLHTDVNTTMLVPTSESIPNQEVLEDVPPQYDLYTNDLLGAWNKVERVIGEKHKTSTSGEDGKHRIPHTTKGTHGRSGIQRARLNAGKSLGDLSDETGLSVSAISNVIHQNKNPRFDTMKKLMGALDVDPEAFYREGPVEPYVNVKQDHVDDGGSEHDEPTGV